MTTADTGASLLRAVLADPASDDARLIYADYLDEQGEADRAEFVRVQVELAREYPGHTDHPEYASEGWHRRDVERNGECPGCRLLDRQNELWAAVSPAFAAPTDRLVRRPRTILVSYPLAPAVTYWLGHQTRPGIGPEDELNLLVCRGFVSEIRLPLAAFLEHARDLFSRHPVQDVVISDAVVHPSGGNDTYYLGGLGRFPKEYWRRLDGLPSVRAVRDAVSDVCLHWGRSLVGLPPL